MIARPRHRSLIPTVSLLLLASGCTPQKSSTTPRPRAAGPGNTVKMTMEPIQIVATKTGSQYKTEAFSAEDLFQQGYAAQKKHDCKGAIGPYQRLLRYFARSPFGAAAHYNLALCLQREEQFAGAAEHFEKAARAVTKPMEQILALGAAGVNYAEARKWAQSRARFKELLARSDLSNAQRLEAQTRYGFAWFKAGNFGKAMDAFDATLRLYRKVRQQERLPTLFYVAMATYYKAGIYHEKFKESPIRLPVKQMVQDMEEKATWMYKAQRGYWRVVKLKNHFWAMAAVYQVGNCYWQYRKAILASPIPRFYDVRYFDKTLKRYEMIRSKEQRTEYFRKLRDKTRVLLRHAMTVYRKGLVTAERIGSKNVWVRRMQATYERIKKRYADDPSLGAPATLGQGAGKRPRSPLLPAALDPNRYMPMAVEL